MAVETFRNMAEKGAGTWGNSKIGQLGFGGWGQNLERSRRQFEEKGIMT